MEAVTWSYFTHSGSGAGGSHGATLSLIFLQLYSQQFESKLDFRVNYFESSHLLKSQCSVGPHVAVASLWIFAPYETFFLVTEELHL